MPISSSAATIEKKKSLRIQNKQKSIDQNESQQSERNLLKIAPALPVRDRKNLYVRSHSSLNVTCLTKLHESSPLREPIVLRTHPDGSVHVSRVQEEKETHPDRISLDRRGLTTIPTIDGEPRLRLLSLQHNLVNNLESLSKQTFPSLVFLDIYDNQLEHIQHLDTLENLRVLLIGKNRIKKIEGLDSLKKIEVLDLHGNQISQVGGLSVLSELKVLNLAGNQLKVIGVKDFQGLLSLQELNLRRNRLKKLLGFAETPNLCKLFISNNDLQSVEDISSLAKSSNLKEISIDNNPVSLGGDCVSFLVSYLPQLTKLNAMQITDQVRKAAMAWRRNKEITNSTFMDLTSDVSLNYRREEVISNARTNWELLRSQTKCLTSNVNAVDKTIKNLKPDPDFILTSLAKNGAKPPLRGGLVKSKTYASLATKVPFLPDKKLNLIRTPSQDTESSNNTSSSNNSGNEFFKLPPILVPIINKLEQKSEEQSKEGGLKLSGSLSSIGPNVNSSNSSLGSGSESGQSSSSSSSKESESESEEQAKPEEVEIDDIPKELPAKTSEANDTQNKSGSTTETSSNLSVATTASNNSVPSNSGSGTSSGSKSVTRNVRSALHGKSLPPKYHVRASTAKAKKQSSPPPAKDREQGGDYLIEICGRYLNVYGQGALRFVDKPWSPSKAHDVTTVKFNYVNFNSVAGVLSKLKHRFPNVDNFTFKETNITNIGQLNALAEVQGLSSIYIDPEGNPIFEKKWKSYAIYRLAHWGLKVINDEEVSDEDIKAANEEYQGLSDLVLWSLPDVLLQPLLVRLRIDVNHGITEQNAKQWLMAADPELRSVVSKEALQWKKGPLSQEDNAMRQKAKQHISGLLEEMVNAMNKLSLLDREWPAIMHGFVQNTLLDYSQLDLYMKQKIQELNK